MKIGIKYCGGCNPVYDRKKVANNLSELLKDEKIEPADESNFYDVILIINGCSRSCANHSLLKGKNTILINSEVDYLRALDLIYKK